MRRVPESGRAVRSLQPPSGLRNAPRHAGSHVAVTDVLLQLVDLFDHLLARPARCTERLHQVDPRREDDTTGQTQAGDLPLTAQGVEERHHQPEEGQHDEATRGLQGHPALADLLVGQPIDLGGEEYVELVVGLVV